MDRLRTHILMILLFSWIIPASLRCEDYPIFDDSIPDESVQMVREVIDRGEELPTQETTVVELEPEIISSQEAEEIQEIAPPSPPAKKRPLIVDDLHKHPSVMTLDAYMQGAQPQAQATTKVKRGAQGIEIVKYINPQMKNFHIDIPAQKVGFWDLLNDAMQKSASIILKRYDLDISKANIEVLKSAYYPNLSLKYYNEYYHGFSRKGSANINGSTYPSSSEYRNSLTLNFDYEIYRFGAKDLKVALAKKELASVKADIDLEKERIAKSLLENYVQALKAQERIKIKQKILFLKNLLLQSTERLFKAGFASRADVAVLRIDQARVEKEILSAKMKIIDAYKNIKILANVDIDPKAYALAMLKPIGGEPKRFEQSAKAKYIQAQLNKKAYELELMKKEYLPTLYAQGGYQLYGADRNNDFDAIGELERNNWNVGITFKWDIFNGFKTNRSVEKLKVEMKKLAEQYRQEKITYQARLQKRQVLREMIQKLLSEEGVLLDEQAIQKDILSRLQQAGDVSILEVDKAEVAKLQSDLNFRLEVIDQLYQDILSELIM